MLRRKPPVEITERARTYAEQLGTLRACSALGVSAPTLARLVAGLPVRPATVRIVARSLAKRDKAADQAPTEAAE